VAQRHQRKDEFRGAEVAVPATRDEPLRKVERAHVVLTNGAGVPAVDMP